MKAPIILLAAVILLSPSIGHAEEPPAQDTPATTTGKIKEGARNVGKAVRETTRAIGHGTRDAAKAIGRETSEAARETKSKAKEVWDDLTKD